MYHVMIRNSGKTVKKGEALSFSIAGFPPNTELEYNISEEKKHSFVGKGTITSDAGGNGNFSTRFDNEPGNYKLYIRNQIYGTASDNFTIEEVPAAPPKTTA